MNAAPATTVQAAPAARRPRDRRASSQATMPPTRRTGRRRLARSPAPPGAAAPAPARRCPAAGISPPAPSPAAAAAAPPAGIGLALYRREALPLLLLATVNPLNAVVAQPARWETNQSYSGRSTPATAPLLASRPSIHITSTSRVTPTIRTSADAASAPGGPAAPSRSRSHPAPGQGVLTPFLSSEVVRNVRNHSPRPPRGSLWRGWKPADPYASVRV